MKLTVVNGSPRGRNSSTTRLMQAFMRGYCAFDQREAEMIYLVKPLDEDTLREIWQTSHVLLLAFPLYVDAMPGQVKAFIESLQVVRQLPQSPRMAFLVHSGFPEALHSRYVARYLKKLTRRLGCVHAGTMLRGGTEGLRSMPEKNVAPLLALLEALGQSLAEQQSLDEWLVAEFAGMERIPAASAWFFRLLSRFGAFNRFWNLQLKINGVYAQRSARPYQPADGFSPSEKHISK